MDILTLHDRYGLAAHEESITDGATSPVSTMSPHKNLLSLENSSLHCHRSSEVSCDKAAQADDESTAKSLQNGAPKAIVESATVDRNSTYLSKSIATPVHLSGWTTQLEGNILSEYFGLAMAVCAVGLLRTVFLSPELAANIRQWKEATANMIKEDVLAPVKRSLLESKHGRELSFPSSPEEHSLTLLLQKINCLQQELLDLKRLRLEDGKANEKVVSIFASKEQAWKEERKNFRDDQQLLCQELQKAYVQQEAVSLQLEQLRGLEKQPCEDCEHREALLSDLKERFKEQEFLIMATVEEAQIEQQEKMALAEKLASVDSSISQMQEQLSVADQNYAVELTKKDEFIQQLQLKKKQAEFESSQLSQDLQAAQANISTLILEKTDCEKTVLGKLSEVTHLRRSVQRKENAISAMLKKAKADSEERTELERELAAIRLKLLWAEKENESFRRLGEVTTRSTSTKTESIMRSKSSFGSRSVLPKAAGIIEELQKLHDVEVKTLHSRYEEQMQMLQKRLSLYQERVTDLEEDILLRMSTDAKEIIAYKEHCLNHGEIIGNECMVIFKESMEAELATKQFQLVVAKSLIKQFMDSETHREQEIENWRNLYLASKAAIEMNKEQDHAGPVFPKYPNLQHRSELERSRYALKLEQRHWQEINVFERQIIARDERMEAFRRQLLQMEIEMKKRCQQVEALTQSLDDANNYNRKLGKELLELKCSEGNKASVRCAKCAAAFDKDIEGEIHGLQENDASHQDLVTEKEMKCMKSLARKAGDTPSVLQDGDNKFRVSKAQLTHDPMVFGTNRKTKEESLLMTQLEQERSALGDHDLNTDMNSETDQELHGMSYKSCLALRRLSSKIQEAKVRTSAEGSTNGEHVIQKEFVDQSSISFYCNLEVAEESRPSVKRKNGRVNVSGELQEFLDDGAPVDKLIVEV